MINSTVEALPTLCSPGVSNHLIFNIWKQAEEAASPFNLY